jgi:hypothetical protein
VGSIYNTYFWVFYTLKILWRSGKMKIHELKTIDPYFQNVWDGNKKFEVRFNDRDFKVGDLLLLKKYDIPSKMYLPVEILCDVIYLLSDEKYVKEGFVVLGIKIIKRMYI